MDSGDRRHQQDERQPGGAPALAAGSPPVVVHDLRNSAGSVDIVPGRAGAKQPLAAGGQRDPRDQHGHKGGHSEQRGTGTHAVSSLRPGHVAPAALSGRTTGHD